MKMLFSTSNRSEVKEVRKKLFEAGIACRIRLNPIARNLFNIPASPEIWIQKEDDILKALRVLGGRRLQQMTVVFPKG
jgi:hypothetical protein